MQINVAVLRDLLRIVSMTILSAGNFFSSVAAVLNYHNHEGRNWTHQFIREAGVGYMLKHEAIAEYNTYTPTCTKNNVTKVNSRTKGKVQ
jgi:hypothetical protein